MTTQVRVIMEYSQPGADTPIMRWERVGDAPAFPAATAVSSPTSPAAAATSPTLATPKRHTDTFELLGRAFEVAQREEGAPFRESLAAFFRGALVRKEDLMDVVTLMNEPA